jgi:hypothetical protein
MFKLRVICFAAMAILMHSCFNERFVTYSFRNAPAAIEVDVTLGPGAYDVEVLPRRSDKARTDIAWRIKAAKLADGRPWVGWDSKGKHISVLLCNPEFSYQVYRFPLISLSETDFNTYNAIISESDANLLASLEVLASKSTQVHHTTGSDLLAWYCSGAAEVARTGRLIDRTDRRDG